jgi:hypothetical protein
MKTRATEKTPPTREELLALVDSGDLTRAQADDVWKKQIVEEVTKKTVNEVGQAQSEQERARRVASELQGYKELVPEVWVEGSEDRVKVGKAFDHLVSLGHDRRHWQPRPQRYSPRSGRSTLFAHPRPPGQDPRIRMQKPEGAPSPPATQARATP